MIIRRITPHLFSLFILSLFSLGMYPLLCKCTDTYTSHTPLSDRPEPVTPRNSMVITDTFRIEVDSNYRIQQKPEFYPSKLDKIWVEMILHGMFNDRGDLREFFVLDNFRIYPYDLDISVFRVPREMIYVGISNLALTYHTVWEDENCESGPTLLIIGTGLYQELP